MRKEHQFISSQVYPKTLLLGICAPYNKTANIQSYYDEFLQLANTYGVVDPETLFIRLRTIDPAYFLSEGKREEVATFCKEHEIEQIIISEPLTPQQNRNLRILYKHEVIDRTALILHIFEQAATSAEGKLQVEIATLQHAKTMLTGRGIDLSQQRGGIGMRSGFGETAKEREIRNIEERVLTLRRKLEQLQQTRATQRKKRLSSKLPLLCLVGYTNAGKSSLLNILTKSDVLADPKLFATLDTTTRELIIDGKKKALVSDTVGFLQMLPPNLIEAFKSTLSELEYATFLLHVIDTSNPDWRSHIEVVHEILRELKINKPMLYVFNKIDLINRHDPVLLALISQYTPNVLVHTISKEGIEPLIEYLRQQFPSKAEKTIEYDDLEENENL